MPAQYVVPGEIVERQTVGNRWFGPNHGLNCAVCHAPITGPTWFDVAFTVLRDHGPSFYRGRGYDCCSRACAEQRANTEPEHPPTLIPTEGHPTDPDAPAGFIYAFDDEREHPEDTERTGKWLVFVPPTDVDAAWDRIKEALHAGRLGASAKVATRPREWREGPRYVVCVYTYDHDDHEDVWRVRATLRDLGFTWRLSYKADAATVEGRYSSNSDSPVALFNG